MADFLTVNKHVANCIARAMNTSQEAADTCVLSLQFSINYEPNADDVKCMLRLVESRNYPKACDASENEDFRKSVWRNMVTKMGNGPNNNNYQGRKRGKNEFDGF